MTTPSPMIALCGLDCATCPIHLATLELNRAKQQSMRNDIARICREQYGMQIAAADVTDCDGCRSASGRMFSGCIKCVIRSCAVGRNITSCAFCTDYPCKKLLKFFESDPAARVRLESMRLSD